MKVHVLDGGGNGRALFITRNYKDTYRLVTVLRGGKVTVETIPIEEVEHLFKAFWFRSYFKAFVA